MYTRTQNASQSFSGASNEREDVMNEDCITWEKIPSKIAPKDHCGHWLYLNCIIVHLLLVFFSFFFSRSAVVEAPYGSLICLYWVYSRWLTLMSFHSFLDISQFIPLFCDYCFASCFMSIRFFSISMLSVPDQCNVFWRSWNNFAWAQEIIFARNRTIAFVCT